MTSDLRGVASSTKLNLRRGERNHGREISIDEAYAKMRGGQAYGGAQWEKGLDCFIPAYLGDRVGYHRLTTIEHCGISETLILVAENGHSIRATAEQQFKVPVDEGEGDGIFRPLRELRSGDRIFVRSEEKASGGRKPNRPRKVIHSVPHHPYASRQVVAGKDYKRTANARLVLEAQLNGISLDDFIEILRRDPARAANLRYLDPGLEVHHKDENPLNDSPENLIAITSDDHYQIHAKEKQKHFGDVLLKECRVRSITPYKRETVFNISLDDPYRAYIAHCFILADKDG
ncbi:HNH endonuclease signature motif containing protein [Mesorhizobium ventifaucium]|uniref:HNH nuclease domain-containing protein n=1 Tax=Mesorhizobium ventifaucium TaxID=666020 RepID=A0ABN8JLA1_9HYPH|nr:HNH endonuclease signature motif containing protein [Mesorhizobium ventifaucium]CAH2398458.1 hypothetical protein MES4922_20115 [Mesorhizobium ventifaucium]